MTIRVVHVGLGPIGAAVARQLAVRKGFRIVAAVDIDPNKIGRDVGEVAELGRPVRVKVTGDLRKAVKATKPDVAVLCTSSSLKSVMPQLEELLKLRLPVVSTTEELAYPAPANRRLAKQVDQMARKAKVAVLGTGVNPGFAMDALPIALTSVCEQIDRIEVRRVQDARIRRLPFQQKIGAGLTRQQFEQQVAVGRRPPRRLHGIDPDDCRRDGLDADAHHRRRAAVDCRGRSAQRAAGGRSQVRRGHQPGGCGVHRRRSESPAAARCLSRCARVVRLGPDRRVAAHLLEGSGGIHGDIATASMTVNSIPRVIAAAPGLRTMRDMPLPSFFAAR